MAMALPLRRPLAHGSVSTADLTVPAISPSPSPSPSTTHNSLHRRRVARPLALALAFVALVLLPLSLLVSEIEITKSSFRSDSAAPGRNYLKCVDTGSIDACVTPLLQMGEPESLTEGAELYPEAIFQVEWSRHVTRADALHLGKLQRGCTAHKESVIPWNFGLVDDANAIALLLNRTNNDQSIIEALRQCSSMDVFIPAGIRGQGYCEDAAAYTKYLHARMLPHWVLDASFFDKTVNRSVSYHELCPLTPLLMLNHYWDGLREKPNWPSTKPLFLMPNIEMFELDAMHLWQADVVLCKTVICAEYVAKWFVQQGNPRLTQVLFTRHTTSDVATNALVASRVEASNQSDWHTLRHGNTKKGMNKKFQEIAFLHTAGTSTQKGTSRVLDCWLSRPDLPRVDIHMSEELYKRMFRKKYAARLTANAANSSSSSSYLGTSNLQLHLGKMDAVAFGTMIANATFFLCTSFMEGYGHYINQARAAGAVILTPNVPPMNELITPSSGVLVSAERSAFTRQFLGGYSSKENGLKHVDGFVSSFSGDDVCAAVDNVVKEMDAQERRRRAHRARQQYLYDTVFFAWKMQQLRVQLKPTEQAVPQ